MSAVLYYKKMNNSKQKSENKSLCNSNDIKMYMTHTPFSVGRMVYFVLKKQKIEILKLDETLYSKNYEDEFETRETFFLDWLFCTLSGYNIVPKSIHS